MLCQSDYLRNSVDIGGHDVGNVPGLVA